MLPAHAGMAPSADTTRSAVARAPRARGDGPSISRSPRGRPWCSPRTRGWPHPGIGIVAGKVVLPAHAGMAPPPGSEPGSTLRAPRARGDGPWAAMWRPQLLAPSPRHPRWPRLPARSLAQPGGAPPHAGMAPSRRASPCRTRCAPRARGDGPGSWTKPPPSPTCSPRTRGWPQSRVQVVAGHDVLPAHAGMAPRPGARKARSRCAPRARGDDPAGSGGPFVLLEVLPAHAGMDPRLMPVTNRISCAPRARGDVLEDVPLW